MQQVEVMDRFQVPPPPSFHKSQKSGPSGSEGEGEVTSEKTAGHAEEQQSKAKTKQRLQQPIWTVLVCSSEPFTKAKLGSNVKCTLRESRHPQSQPHGDTKDVVERHLIANSSVQPKMYFATNVAKKDTMQKCACLGLWSGLSHL